MVLTSSWVLVFIIVGPFLSWSYDLSQIRVRVLEDVSYPKIQADKVEFQKNLDTDTLLIKGRGIRVNNKAVGDLVQFHRKNNRWDVISFVTLEKYLAAVLDAELPKKWPIETKKALVIASRSYSIFQMKNRQRENFDIEGNIKDQAFFGAFSDESLRVVRSVRNKILVWPDGKIFKAYYHSHCGGHTSTAQEVFGDDRGVAAISDPYCSDYKWSVSISKEKIRSRIPGFLGLRVASPIQNRLVNVTWLENSGLLQSERANLWRWKIGSNKLKSTWFQITELGDSIQFNGHGFGHGVGLCQWGSFKMGVLKKTYQQILEHYYSGIEIVNGTTVLAKI